MDAALKHAVFGLSSTALATGPLADRITFVETALGHAHLPGSSAGATSGAGGAAGGAASGSMGRSLYADEVAAALGTPNWQMVEAQLAVELTLPDPNPLRLHCLLISSVSPGIRRLALLFQTRPTHRSFSSARRLQSQ